MSALNTLKNSREMMIQLCSSKSENRLSLPNILENFNLAISTLEGSKELRIEQLNAFVLNSDNLDSLSEKSKLYALNDGKRLLLLYKVNKGDVEYILFHNSSMLGASNISSNLYGYYICTFALCADAEHYEPESFSYLYLPRSTSSKLDIIPLLTLQQTIPDYAEYHWPFLAMRFFNKNISDQVEYKYLLTDKDEIDLFKTVELYD